MGNIFFKKNNVVTKFYLRGPHIIDGVFAAPFFGYRLSGIYCNYIFIPSSRSQILTAFTGDEAIYAGTMLIAFGIIIMCLPEEKTNGRSLIATFLGLTALAVAVGAIVLLWLTKWTK